MGGNNAPETHPPPGFLESTPPDISAPKITSRQPHPKHLHIRPITPFLVPGGMDIRGEARSSIVGNLWRWVFSHPGREAGSGTTLSRVWRQCTGEQDLSTPTRPAQGFPQPGFVSKTDKTDRPFRNGASRRVCYGSGCLEDAKTLKTDDRTQAPSKTDKTYNSFSHHRFLEYTAVKDQERSPVLSQSVEISPA